MARDLPPLLPLAPDADVNSIRQGDRRFASRYLAMQLFDHGLTDETLRALGRVMSIKVAKEMGEPCTERYARKLRGADRTDPADAVRFAQQQSLTRDERKVLHRVLRLHGRVPGAREAVAVALGLVDDYEWRAQVTIHETGLLKPQEFEQAARLEAEAIVHAALGASDLIPRFEARLRQQPPHEAASAVLAEALAEQTAFALNAPNATAVARDVGVTVETAQRWARLPDWEPRVRETVKRSYLARRAVLRGPASIVRLWRAERTR